MSLRFFCDHCIPYLVTKALREAGYEALRLRDYLPQDSKDPTVIAKAQELDAVLISLNGDFSDIVAYPPSRFKGIIGIQIHNHPEVLPEIMQRLIMYLSTNPNPEFYRGKLLLAEPHRIRIR